MTRVVQALIGLLLAVEAAVAYFALSTAGEWRRATGGSEFSMVIFLVAAAVLLATAAIELWRVEHMTRRSRCVLSALLGTSATATVAVVLIASVVEQTRIDSGEVEGNVGWYVLLAALVPLALIPIAGAATLWPHDRHRARPG